MKALGRLESAELVLYDALVAPEVVALASAAQRFCVGKRAGQKSVSQPTIHRLMIRGARQGKRVVRLKCGDPFVLGRGGEEALALRAAGIPFEVVPGLTSVVAAPELAGIPLTHRGVASGFVVVSGHADSAFRPILEAVAPNSLTVVVLMGLASRARVATQLIDRGWRPDTPTAVVMAASTDRMHSWLGRLDGLSTLPVGGGDHAPGTIVIGDVVALRSLINARSGSGTFEAVALAR